MGEAKRKQELTVREMAQAIGVETLGGRIQVKWDSRSAATPFGQMAFFIEFLKLTGLYARWQDECPQFYQGPHRSKIADILGTWFLSVLSGHRRYAHITTIRADGVMPDLLGMSCVVSEDTVRRGLNAIEEVPGRQWLQDHLDASVWVRRESRLFDCVAWLRSLDHTCGSVRSSLSTCARSAMIRCKAVETM